MVSWQTIWQFLRKWLLNKYVITCIAFALILTFCGEHSLINRVKQAKQIKALKQEKEECLRQSEQYRHDIQTLQQNTDSLERFAREHYYFHEDGETVYLVEE